MDKKLKALRLTQTEVTALVDYLLAEAYFSGKQISRRFRVPYEQIDENEKAFQGANLIVDIHVYFDGAMTDERDAEHQKLFKVTGPNKTRH